MADPFLQMFGWLTPVMQRDPSADFAAGTPERAILDEFR